MVKTLMKEDNVSLLRLFAICVLFGGLLLGAYYLAVTDSFGKFLASTAAGFIGYVLFGSFADIVASLQEINQKLSKDSEQGLQ